MRILIVGKTSTVGAAVGRLLSSRHEVLYAGRHGADYFLDLNATDCSPPADSFDVVIHVAADFGGNEEKDLVRAETVNAIGTLNVCRLAYRAKVRHLLVISSASAAYSPGEPYYGAYSLSKRHAEELAALYCSQQNIPLTILRPSQIYDAESRCSPHQSLFYSIVERAAAGKDIVFFGKNDALRNYIFLDDVSEVISRVIDKQVVGLYSCFFPESHRLSQIAGLAQEVFGKGGRVIFDAEKPDIPDLKLQNERDLYHKLCYEPAIRLEDGFAAIKLHREKL